MTVYHFVGIKGAGMSALAQVMFDKGYQVQGSDVEKYYFTQKALEEKGIPIYPFSFENIQENLTIIAGNAFPDSHEEIKRALDLGLPVIRYHKFLGELAASYKSIAITGSHGKTSTTGLLSHVLNLMNPTSYLIGDGTGKGCKEAEYFAFEACEYQRHFLAYQPDYAIMTNIDWDHPDYFKSVDDVFNAFETLGKQVKKAVFALGDDVQLRRLHLPIPVVYFGFGDKNEFQAKNIIKKTTGTIFDVYHRGKFLDTFEIPMYGEHNVLNALSTIAFMHFEGLSLAKGKEHLKGFKGVKRRFSITESEEGGPIRIDDYAHHQSEIRATINAAKQKYPDRKIIAIFQPHTFTRTQAFLQEFADSLNLADQVYLCDIFSSAREKSGNLSILDLAKKTKGHHILRENNVEVLLQHTNAVLIFMGAGDVQKFLFAFEKVLAANTMMGGEQAIN